MDKLSRRQFLGKSALGIGSVVMASQFPFDLASGSPPASVKMPVGFQSWIVREKMGNDFPGTLKMVADMGYQSVEMCSPVGYESLGFGPLKKYKPIELNNLVNDLNSQEAEFMQQKIIESSITLVENKSNIIPFKLC